MARDCTVNRDPNATQQTPPPMLKGGFDSEYASLMAELGESGKGPGGDSKPWTGSAGHDITAGGSNIPPWRRPEVWQTNIPPPQNTGYRPPQPGYGAAPGYSGYSAPGYGQGYGTGGNYYQQPQEYSANYAQYYQNQYSQQAAAPAH